MMLPSRGQELRGILSAIADGPERVIYLRTLWRRRSVLRFLFSLLLTKLLWSKPVVERWQRLFSYGPKTE